MNGDGLGVLLPGVPAAGDGVPPAPRLVGPAPRGQQLRINFLANQDHILQARQARHGGQGGRKVVPLPAPESGPPLGPPLKQGLEPQVAGGVFISASSGLGSQWATATPSLAALSTPSPTGSVSSIQRLLPKARSAAKKATRNRVLSLLAAASLFEGAILIGLIVFTYFYMKRDDGDICQSVACVRSAASLLRSMDTRVSPCHDFYQYTCGRWSEDHPSPAAAFSHDWFYDRREHVLLGVQEFLSQNSTAEDPWAVGQARILYEACLDRDAWDALGLEPLLATLDAVGLPRQPPLEPDPAWVWERTAALARKHINKDLLVNLDVVPDVKNRSVNRILVRKYRSGSPLLGYHGHRVEDRRHRILARSKMTLTASDPDQEQTPDGGDPDKGDERHLKAYLSYMITAMNVLMHANETDKQRPSSPPPLLAPLACTRRAEPPPERVTRAARRVLDFNRKLYKLAFPENKTEVRDKDPEEMWVWELQNFTHATLGPDVPTQINWTEFLTAMFASVPNVTLDLTKDKLVVEDDEYMQKLAQLLAKTPRQTIQLSLWWELVDLLAPYSTAEMRQLRRRYQEIASGTSGATTRESVCTEAVNGLMGMAVSYHLADAAYLRTTGEKVLEMLGDVKSVFEDLVAELNWMDAATKAATLGKVRAMRSFVGFPEWLLRPDKLDEYYEGLNMTRQEYLGNVLSFQRLVTESSLSVLRRINTDDGWATDPTDVNAFHTFQANSVTIPAGILQFPFYDLGLEALNYGAIGSILGHELTHGFDSYGRLFDRDGNMRPWWSNATVAEYEKRTDCFVKQYGDYFLPEVDMNVDGELTLGENIADNGGLHESVRAYRRYLQRHRLTEPRLPGMANYTHEQLLFLSYVHLWCESWTEESLRWGLEDEHAPNRVRTWGVLSNSEDFARAWGCSRGTAMNPDRPRCRLW